MGNSNALQTLKAAQEMAQARAKEERDNQPPPPDVSDLDEAECFVRLVIAMYASQLTLGMGVLPDGMAVYLRLRVPSKSTDPRAGMVSFVASDDTLSLLRKAVCALEASETSRWWKPDRFANGPPTTT